MLLYLLRHADAEGVRTTDAARELTPEGKRQAAAVGAYCQRQGIGPELILASPYRRTMQTAEAVARALGGVTLQNEPFLKSGMDPLGAFEGLQGYGWAGSLLLVGHQPDLGQLAAALLGINDAGGMEVGKATLIALEVDRLAPRGGSLRFFVPVEMI